MVGVDKKIIKRVTFLFQFLISHRKIEKYMFKIINLHFYLRINKIQNIHKLKKATYTVVTVKTVKYLEMVFSLFKFDVVKFCMNNYLLNYILHQFLREILLS